MPITMPESAESQSEKLHYIYKKNGRSFTQYHYFKMGGGGTPPPAKAALQARCRHHSSQLTNNERVEGTEWDETECDALDL